MDREQQIIDRIEAIVLAEGIIRKNIYGSAQYGIGSSKSYFDVLVDKRLEGKSYPTAQEVFEEMKMNVNYLTRSLVKASEDYAKLETKIRGLENDIRDLIRENSESK